jgi:hypothetical protein
MRLQRIGPPWPPRASMYPVYCVPTLAFGSGEGVAMRNPD